MTERYTGEEFEPIAHWFVPATAPEGGAPDEVRAQWVGVPLPVRESNAVISEEDLIEGYRLGTDVLHPGRIQLNNPNELVTIKLDDAIKALALAERYGAAEWWEKWREVKPLFLGEKLMFKAAEGNLCTGEEVAHSPWTADFDLSQP